MPLPKEHQKLLNSNRQKRNANNLPNKTNNITLNFSPDESLNNGTLNIFDQFKGLFDVPHILTKNQFYEPYAYQNKSKSQNKDKIQYGN